MNTGRANKRFFGALMLVIFLCALVHLCLCPDEDCPVCPTIKLLFSGFAVSLLLRGTYAVSAARRAAKTDSSPKLPHSLTLLSQHTCLKS